MTIAADSPVGVMFVCLGNICRSPLAHGVFEEMVKQAHLDRYFEVASSGTGAWHIGQQPDARMRRTAKRHGLSLDHLQAQQFGAGDLPRYHHIFVMDRENQAAVLRLDHHGKYQRRVELFRTYDPVGGRIDVPDPYYAGGFDEVYQIVERTCRAILRRLIVVHGLPTYSPKLG